LNQAQLERLRRDAADHEARAYFMYYRAREMSREAAEQRAAARSRAEAIRVAEQQRRVSQRD
jgi:hypothetical protein